MGKFQYRVYYDYVEAARSARTPETRKNDAEIAQALRNFQGDLEQCLPGNAPKVKMLLDAHSMKVIFETSLGEADAEKLVEECLCRLHLCGRKLVED